MSDSSSWELEMLELARAGNGDALNALLAESYDPLLVAVGFEIGQQLSPTYTAEDCVQDTYSYVVAHIADFAPNGEGAFLGWLKRIARSRAIDAARAAGAAKRGGGARRVRVSDDMASRIGDSIDAVAAESGTPSRVFARKDISSAVRVALGQLNENERLVIVARLFENEDWPVIASNLGNTVSGVRSIGHRALTKLQELMGGMSRFASVNRAMIPRKENRKT